jgi:hypothetical protein
MLKAAPRATAAAARAEGSNPSGPQTDAGTHQSPRRSHILLPGEDAEKLRKLTAAFYDYLRPQNLAEGALVDSLITDVWCAARVVGYLPELHVSSAKDLARALRYVDTTRKMFRSTLRDFARFRKAKGDPQEPCLEVPQILQPPSGPFENFYEQGAGQPITKRTQAARKSVASKTK